MQITTAITLLQFAIQG